MACRGAPACRAVLDQADERWPDRSRASDGICASAQHHQQNPGSDHEPDFKGIAHAVDLTHDPAHGCDVDAVFAAIIARQDPRVKYLIRNRQIIRSYKTSPKHPAPWTPQAYTGPNPHEHHGHISVWTEHENDTSPWFEEDDMFTDDDRKVLAALSGRLAVVEQEVAIVRGALKGLDSKGGPSYLKRRFDELLAAVKK